VKVRLSSKLHRKNWMGLGRALLREYDRARSACNPVQGLFIAEHFIGLKAVAANVKGAAL
jgi:hypothetical protein